MRMWLRDVAAGVCDCLFFHFENDLTMKAYKTVGIYGEGTAYILENLGDWDEYEEFLLSADLMKFNPNFYEFKKDFFRNAGKFVEFAGELYKVAAAECDETMADWYYICENINDKYDRKYYLMGDVDLERRLMSNIPMNK